MSWAELYGLHHPLGYALRVLTVLALLFVGRAVGILIVRVALHRARHSQRLVVSPRRMATLDTLLSSTITFVAIIIALFGGLIWLGANSGILFPLLGLFGAGFGLGIRGRRRRPDLRSGRRGRQADGHGGGDGERGGDWRPSPEGPTRAFNHRRSLRERRPRGRRTVISDDQIRRDSDRN